MVLNICTFPYVLEIDAQRYKDIEGELKHRIINASQTVICN